MDEPKKCPACQKIVAEEAVQCDACLVIFAKWKNPTQRQAEKRLAEISKSSSKGFPKGILVVLLGMIGLPLAIYTVPDLETRVLGGKLAYHLHTGQTFTHLATLHTVVTQNPDGNPIDETVTTLLTTLRVRESDSGGNVTLTQTFDQLRLDSKWDSTSLREKDASILQSWTLTNVMSPLGASITTMATVADQMRQTTKIQKNLAAARVKSVEGQAMRQMEESMETKDPPTPVESNPYDRLMEALSPGKLEALNYLAKFKYSRGRLRTGDHFKYTLPLAIGTKIGVISQPITVDMTIKDFKRTNEGFYGRLVWDVPYQPKFPVTGAQGQGTYKGEAWLNYNTGLIDELNGTIEVSFDSNPILHVLSHQKITPS